MNNAEFEALDKIEAENLRTAFAAVFHSEAGKRVLFHILEQAGMYRDPYAGDMTNATNYQLGLQAAGRKLIADLDTVDPRFYPQLLIDVANLRDVEKAEARAVAARVNPTEDKEDSADEA